MPQMELDFSQANSDPVSTMASLLIVIGEAVTEDHKNLILADLTKGLRCVDLEDVGIDINEELAKLANKAETGEEGPDDERVIQYVSEKLAVEILVNPHVQTVQQSLKNFLSTSTNIRHLLFAGQYFGGNGSWILQDHTFSVANLAQVFKTVEEEVKQQNGNKFSVFSSANGEWKSSTIAKFSACKNWEVKVNPAESLTNVHGILQFTAYISNFLRTKGVNELLKTSDVVGNIRFSKPTLYIFPGSEGDSSLFGISGFNLLVNGGFKRRSCFWDFCRHLDRIDAVLMTHLNTDNVFGVSSMLARKNADEIHPEIGYVYLNAGEKMLHSSVNEINNKEPSLSVSLADEGSRIIEFSKQLGHMPHPCTRNATSKEVHPINLYHKVGHGSLDMYILNPVTDSKELKDFYQQWNKQVADFGSLQNVSLPNMLSVCSLLIWKPANPTEKICRIFFPGNAPQHKVLEGLDKLKQLDVLKHANCTGQSLQQSKVSPKKAASSSARPASSRLDRTTKPPSSSTQRKPETKESTRSPRPKSTVTQKSTKVSKEDENKMKAEDKGSKSKTPTSHAKPSPAKPTKSSTPKKTSPVEKMAPVVNSEPEKAVKEEVKTEKSVVEEVPSQPVPPQEPLVDLLSNTEQEIAAAVKAADEALQQATSEPAKTSESESPEPLPDPSQYNQAKNEPTEIIPQNEFKSSPEDFGFESHKFDTGIPNGGMPIEPVTGFEENHIDESEDIKPESLPEPVAYSAHEPDIIPETDSFIKESQIQESMMTSSTVQSEPDVVKSVQNESDISSADSAVVSSPQDEELQTFEEEEAAVINEARLTAEEKGVSENVVNGVLDNLDDDGIMYGDDEEEEEVQEDDLEKDAETEKELIPCDKASDEIPKSVDLLQHEPAMHEQQNVLDETPVESSQMDDQKELCDEETEDTESAKLDVMPSAEPDIIGDESPTVEKQDVEELEETESEQAESGHLKEAEEETESERTDPFATPELECRDDIAYDQLQTESEVLGVDDVEVPKDDKVLTSDKPTEQLPDEPEQTKDVIDVMESKDDEEEQDEDDMSPDEGDSQTGGQRDNISPELEEQTEIQTGRISSDLELQTEAQRDRISPDLEEQTEAQQDRISPDLMEQTEAQRDSILSDLEKKIEAHPDRISPDVEEQIEAERDRFSPDLEEQTEAQRDRISPEQEEQSQTQRDSVSPEIDVSPEADVDVQEQSDDQIEPLSAGSELNASESQGFKADIEGTEDETSIKQPEIDSCLLDKETEDGQLLGNDAENDEHLSENLDLEDEKDISPEEEEELKEYERQIEQEMQSLQEQNGECLEVSNIPEAFEKDETPDPKDVKSSQPEMQELPEHQVQPHKEQMDADSDFDEQEEDEKGEISTSRDDSSPDSDIIVDHQTGTNASYNPFGDINQPQTNGSCPDYNPFEGLDQGKGGPSTEQDMGQQTAQSQHYGFDSGPERTPQMYGIGFGMDQDQEMSGMGMGQDQEMYGMGFEAVGGQTNYAKGLGPESDQHVQQGHKAEPWDPETEWGKPMGLPSPPPPEDTSANNVVKQNGKPTSNSPGKSKSATKTIDAKRPDSAKSTSKVGSEKRTTSATNKGPLSSSRTTETKTRTSTLNTSRTESKSNPSKRPTSAPMSEPKTKSTGSRRPATTTGSSRSSPLVAKMPPLPPFTAFYVDLTYIPNHGDPQYSNIDFFKRIRARFYVLSSLSPNIKTLDALLEAKETWEDKDLQVTIIPTYDNEMLRHWMSLNKERLTSLGVDVAPSASRCTIQLQDHETSCSAYRLEF